LDIAQGRGGFGILVMLSFKSKVTIAPEGVIFRALAGDGPAKFLATADCLKTVAKMQEMPNQGQFEAIFSDHRDSFETAACKVFERLRTEAEARDPSANIRITLADLKAS
jgi:hypothetical protein